MPRIKLTPEFGDTLKKMRQSKKLTLNDVADKIGKSTGYISNIENCKTDIVNLEDIYELLDYLTNSDDEIKAIMINHIDNIPLLYSSDEIEKLNTIHAFDRQYRDITIEDGYIQYIKKELEENNFSAQQVIEELNSNRFIEEKYLKDAPKNKLIFADSGDPSIRHSYIVFDLPITLLDDILSKKQETLNYITLKGILYAINVLKGLPNEKSQENASNILYQNKIYTLSERRELIDAEKISIISSGIRDKTFNIENSKLPPDVITFYKLLDQYINIIEFINDKSPKYVNSKLEVMLKNLENPKTSSLSLGLMGLPLDKIGELPPSLQKDFFSEIKKLIDQFSNREKTVEIVEFE